MVFRAGGPTEKCPAPLAGGNEQAPAGKAGAPAQADAGLRESRDALPYGPREPPREPGDAEAELMADNTAPPVI
jgi:hypothetical protein